MKKVNLQDYKKRKLQLAQAETLYRQLCLRCMHPEFSCYCSTLQPFDSQMQFVILIHPIEYHRRIATGRMSHLILKNSQLIKGQDFTHETRVNEIIQNPMNHCVILYPGKTSINLSQLTLEQRKDFTPSQKKLTVFVIDGTWATARQMLRHSLNLHQMPRVCFDVTKPSQFKVRKQPEPHCLSTIEAIHELIELMGPAVDFDVMSKKHEALLHAFSTMVERQIEFVNKRA